VELILNDSLDPHPFERRRGVGGGGGVALVAPTAEPNGQFKAKYFRQLILVSLNGCLFCRECLT